MRALIFAALVALAAACSNAPSRSDCNKLLDKTVEIEIKASLKPGTALDPTELDRQVRALKSTAGKQFIEECVDKLPRSRVACGLKAATKEQLLACDEG